MIRYSHPAYSGAVEEFTFSTGYWPIPEKVFEAVPFLHGVSLPLVFVGIMTFILILSSVTMVLAVEAGHRMDRKKCREVDALDNCWWCNFLRVPSLGVDTLYCWD